MIAQWNQLPHHIPVLPDLDSFMSLGVRTISHCMPYNTTLVFVCFSLFCNIAFNCFTFSIPHFFLFFFRAAPLCPCSVVLVSGLKAAYIDTKSQGQTENRPKNDNGNNPRQSEWPEVTSLGKSSTFICSLLRPILFKVQ